VGIVKYIRFLVVYGDMSDPDLSVVLLDVEDNNQLLNTLNWFGNDAILIDIKKISGLLQPYFLGE